MMSLPHRVVLIAILSGCAVLASNLALAGSLHSTAGAQSSQGEIHLQSCEVRNIEGGGRCGSYDVYENRSAKVGRQISLNILVLPALNTPPLPDPVFWLDGGPGIAATEAAFLAKGGFLEGLRKEHDLVFVDQRGTGKSNPLRCDVGDDPANLESFFGKLFPIDQVRMCREKLEKIADLRLYTTPIAMDDLDEVRDALGYGKINIVAESYGSIAAQVFVRQHPDHVRAVFLTGVATPGFRLPLPFARAAQNALDLLFLDCRADQVCHAAFPNLQAEFDAVLSRFNQGPLDVTLIDPTSKQTRHVKLERQNYVERLRLLLYTTTLGRFVPLIVHEAFQNNFVPFESISVAYNLGSTLSRGMYLSVTCSESVPFISGQEVAPESRGTFVGETRVRSHMGACKEWPRGNISRSFTDPIKSKLPILMFSGEVDGSTPPSLGAKAMKYLSNARQIRARYYGHQLNSPCMWGIMQKFIQDASVRGIDISCVEKIQRPPFATEIPSQFALK
jgi:pimeloyl-ACP methyl ester carboxylesterase